MKKTPILGSLIIVLTVTAAVLGFTHFSPYINRDNPTINDAGLSQLDANDNATSTANKDENVEVRTVKKVSQPAEPTRNLADVAPKQAEIKESVVTEYVYYPLLTANDPGYASNWALEKMNASTAWDIATGDGSTIVAVIDSGFALTHDDLINSWHENPGETGTTVDGDLCWTGTTANKQTNNCDDDQNGYEDDWRGWNFVLGDNNPAAGRDNPNGDAVSHGTETAGLVGAAGNNATGITTINWNTKIMPLQALSDDGPGYTSDVAAAIYYAVDNGASVINMSLGGIASDEAILAATNYAYTNDVVVVAASGNCGTGNELGCEDVSAGYITYPARNPHVISVGASTSTDARASFSSYGAALDITAPGSGAINTPTWTPSDGTSLYTTAIYGTSYSSPLIASLASLIKSIRPDSSPDDITALILGTARQPSGMNGYPYTTVYGHGIADAHKALTVATSLNSVAEAPTLLQAGSSRSEHNYSTNHMLGSGCETQTAQTYCTIWIQQEGTLYDRYLPYNETSSDANTGWTWHTSLLGSGGLWNVRAVQGDSYSTAYPLSRK